MADAGAHLVEATRDHLREMMRWFPNRESTVIWGGWEFRFPFTEETFTADARWREAPSYSLVSDSHALLGFGQYYLRVDRCHLGRLIIAPGFRGKGLGTKLIALLSKDGMRELGVEECSLFVAVANTQALALYERLGFERTPYPGNSDAAASYHYMVAHAHQNVAAMPRRSMRPPK